MLCFACLFVVLRPTSKVISGQVPTRDSVHSWQLTSAVPLGNQPDSTTALSWHWANQSLLYPNNAKSLAKKQQVSILMSLVWFDEGSKPQGSDSLIPKWETRHSTHSAISFGSRRFANFRCGSNIETPMLEPDQINLGRRSKFGHHTNSFGWIEVSLSI